MINGQVSHCSINSHNLVINLPRKHNLAFPFGKQKKTADWQGLCVLSMFNSMLDGEYGYQLSEILIPSRNTCETVSSFEFKKKAEGANAWPRHELNSY
jgi:hypothetical protein